MGFARHEYWSGLPFPSPVDLSNPGIKPRSPALQVDSLLFEPPGNFVLNFLYPPGEFLLIPQDPVQKALSL